MYLKKHYVRYYCCTQTTGSYYTGLPMSEVHNAEWQRLEQRMQYHQAATEELLELWLADRLAEQTRTPMPSPYGSILVR